MSAAVPYCVDGLRVGSLVEVRGVLCRVFAVHPLGTVDVEEVNGGRCWRLSGLAVRS